MPDEMRVRLLARAQPQAAFDEERVESAARALRAQKPRHRRLDLSDRRRGAPEPKRLRFAAGDVADEGSRLGALERGRQARERECDEGQDIGAEGERDAADQRIFGKRSQRRGPEPGEAERPRAQHVREPSCRPRERARTRRRATPAIPRSFPPPPREPCRGARSDRRGTPARSARARRKRAARSKPAPRPRRGAHRESRASARTGSPRGARRARAPRSRPRPRSPPRRGDAAGSA